MGTHPLLVKAAQHTAQARAINDEFEGKVMPAEAAREMEDHLGKASEYRQRVQREAALVESEQWISEPQYKHDMSNGTKIAEAFGHGRPIVAEQKSEHERKAFFDYVRKGMGGLGMEQKAALTEESGNSAGQVLIPTDFAGTILKELPRLATIRNLAYIRPTTKNRVDVGALAIDTAGWGKLEVTGASAPQDGLPAVPASTQQIEVHDLNALVKLGRDELEDSDENLEQIIRDALALKFSELEDDAFASGSGTARPWAITHNVTQNVTAATNNTPTPDDLKKLTFAVPSQFRSLSRSVFLWHSLVEQAVALMKDNNGNYLMQNRPSESEPGTFMGYKWYTVDGLASPAATGTATDKSVVFGDVFNGYMVADRRRLSVQRLTELYAAEGKIGLLFTHRVGGDVIRPKALAFYNL